MIVRRLARVLLAGLFVMAGVDTLRNPKPRVAAAGPFLDRTVGKAADVLPDAVPTDHETLVKLDALVKVVAGAGLGLSKFPRLCAFVLAVDLVPTTLAGHPFWEHEDPSQRGAQQAHFLKNASILGGLLVAASSPSDRAQRKNAKNAKKSPAPATSRPESA
jgi:uncharacterized membrane protein YphA (DoxX/SURF4 family)